MEKYKKYFENILSKSWLGQKSSGQNISHILISAVYAEIEVVEKSILLGKAENFYFLIEYFSVDNYNYSNILLNDNFEILLNSYKEKDKLLNGITPTEYLEVLTMKNSLENSLIKKERTIKSFKL